MPQWKAGITAIKLKPYIARNLTPAEAKQHVFGYIEVYYNRKRLRSTLSYLSPEAFEVKRVS